MPNINQANKQWTKRNSLNNIDGIAKRVFPKNFYTVQIVL